MYRVPHPAAFTGRTLAAPDDHRPEGPILLASVINSTKVRVFGLPQNSPIRSARSKSGSIRAWSSPARRAGPRALQALPEAALQPIRPLGEGYAAVPTKRLLGVISRS